MERGRQQDVKVIGCSSGARSLLWDCGQEFHRALAVFPSSLTTPPFHPWVGCGPTYPCCSSHLSVSPLLTTWGRLPGHLGWKLSRPGSRAAWMGRQDISVAKTPPFSSRNFFPALSLRSGGCAFFLQGADKPTADSFPSSADTSPALESAPYPGICSASTDLAPVPRGWVAAGRVRS